MSKCRIRLLWWLAMTGSSIAVGIALDVALDTERFALVVRVVGLAAMLLARVPLQRTGRLLRMEGDPEEWGCTTRLVTHDIYRCVRHPHHVFVGIFMTGLALLIGHPASFLVIAGVQWAWVAAFLLLVEEPELEQKFGDAYLGYRRDVPMIVPRMRCLLAVLRTPIATLAAAEPDARRVGLKS